LVNILSIYKMHFSFFSLSKFFRFFYAILIFSIPGFLYAAGDCSPYIGQATLNEFFKDQSNQSIDVDDFVEVKILNDAIAQTTYETWTIKICEKDAAGNNNDADGCSGDISLSDFTDKSKPWLVLKNGTIGSGYDIGKYINLKTGFDATLLDANGDLIDYLTVDGYSDAITGISCSLSNLVFDYQISIPGVNDKTIFRSPDGTGDWDGAPAATAPPTEDTTNDNLPTPPAGESYPFVTINNVSLSTPGTASFTVSLVDAAGNSTTFSQTITISYYTQDGTATVADTDYTAVPIATPSTITIAAGQSSTTLTVDSPSSTDADAGEYFYAVLQAVQNSADNDGNPNAVISKHYGTATLNGPVAEWNFDICTISAAFDIKDTSGNNLHASPINGIATSAGKICTALSLDGSNDYAEVADNASLDMTENFTVMVWIRPDTIPNSGLMTILSKDENYEFHINSSGRINWWWNNSSGATRQFNSTAVIATNVWTHVAIVYELGSQRIIINGVESGSTSYNETLRTNSDPLHIGGDQLFAGRYFDGLIDEVKVYRRALSTTEINSYYNNPNPTNRVCPTCVAPTCDTFRDEFSTQSYSQQNGTVNWATNWIETGDNNNASSGDIQILSGELQLEGDGASPSVEREADLSGYDSATLTFDYRTSGNWEASDNVKVYISNDGGANWTLQNTISNDQASNTSTVTLAASFLTSNFRIRFVEGSSRWNEIFHIDNVQINACSTSALHHIKITHDGTALTCEPESITVTACANAACTTPHYPNDVSITLTPTGWVGGDTKTISGGSTVFQLRNSTPGSVTLSASASSPATSIIPSPSVSCLNSTTNSTSCDLTYYDSGFIYTIPTQISCETSATPITITAVRKDLTTQKCVSLFTGPVTKTIDFTISAAPSPDIIMNNGLANEKTFTSAAATQSVDLSFNNSASTFTLTHNNAGQFTLNASHVNSGLTMLGTSSFVVRPHSYFFEAAYDNAGTEVSLNNATTAGNPKWKASDNFRLRLRGQCQNGTVTTNYSPTNSEMQVELNLPTGGANNNLTLQGTNYLSSATATPTWHNVSSKFNVGAVTDGANDYANTAFHEVGVLKLHVRDSNYFGVTIPEQTLSVGRFTPHHFDTIVTDACTNVAPLNSFTYSGQPITVQTKAMNNLATPTVTQNYNGTSFAKAVTLSTTSSVVGSFGTTGNISASDFISGSYIKNNVAYTFTSKDSGPDASFLIRAIDTDGITSNNASANEGTTDMRSGRMQLENVFGSELTALTMPLKVEHYLNSGFSINTDDTCTTYDATAGSLTNYTGNLSTGETTVTGASAISGGVANITFSAPGAGNEGSVNLLANNVSSWLTYNWNVDCDNADTDNDITTGIDAGLCGPFGTASFGLYRGDDRIIYWREVF
jgi:hypothetical protein